MEGEGEGKGEALWNEKKVEWRNINGMWHRRDAEKVLQVMQRLNHVESKMYPE